jgi:glucokinase
MTIIVGDIGGTKTDLAVFSSTAGLHNPLANKTFASADYPNLEAIITQFLSEININIDQGCFGVAGPVVADEVNITNLPWVVTAKALRSTFGWHSVRLLNDLEAVAYAIPVLSKDDLYTLNVGKTVPSANIAVIAPGTGLGEAFLTYTESGHIVHASEGGHASFSPTNELQDGLLKFLRVHSGKEHISVERVCSGGWGIPNIYNYLKEIGHAEESDRISKQLKNTTDVTPIIIRGAQDTAHPCRLCAATLDMFISILGAEAGNLALKVLSIGGIYLGGGIPRRILEALQKPLFLESLRNKGRFRELLTDIPVHVITNKQAGLIGAAAYALMDSSLNQNIS